MKTITFCVAAVLCFFVTELNAQETFKERVEAISENMQKITKEERDSLKIEVEQVNTLLENNEITAAEAEQRKNELAEKRARNIETRMAVEEEKLAQVIKDKIDGKIPEEETHRFGLFSYSKAKKIKDTATVRQYSYKRTTSQFVFAAGVNRIVTDGEVDTDNFKWRSDFYEWGVSWNTRILKTNNLLHAKYGLSLQYNNLRPSDDRVFVTDGGQTGLADSGLDLKVARLRYVNLVVPAHLEFDFTKKKVNGDKVYFPSHKSFRLGLGGYAGLNVKEKQIIKYSDDGNKVKNREKGDFNVSDFVYGVSAYVGYGEVSLYAKYDLQPVFANNPVDSNNLSLGIRFDFN